MVQTATVDLGTTLIAAMAIAGVGILVLGVALLGRCGVRAAWWITAPTRSGLADVAALQRRPAAATDAGPELPTALPEQPVAQHVEQGAAALASALADARLDQPLDLDAGRLASFATLAGHGEVLNAAIRRVDQSLVALETEGWVQLLEIQLGEVVIRRGLIGPAGVFVLVARPPAWRPDGDIPDLARQRTALAAALGIDAADVQSLVVREESEEEPRMVFAGPGFSGALVLDRRSLVSVLLDMPARIGLDALERIRADIAHATARSADRARLPTHAHDG